MSKSRNNSVPLRATPDETARLLSRAKTDSQRHITYEPELRPEVSNLVLLTALCRDTTPAAVAAEIGAGGAAALKRAAIEAVNDRFAGLRARREALAADPGYLRSVLAAGNQKASSIAAETLGTVRRANASAVLAVSGTRQAVAYQSVPAGHMRVSLYTLVDI